MVWQLYYNIFLKKTSEHSKFLQRLIEAFLYDETIWLPLNKIAELFEKDKSVISRHISNIFEEQELTVDSTVANFATVQTEGNRKVNRNIDYYNLDMIIAVRI